MDYTNIMLLPTWYIVCIPRCAWVCVLWWSDGWYSNDIIMIFWWSITCFIPSPASPTNTKSLTGHDEAVTVIILFHQLSSLASQHGWMLNDQDNLWLKTGYKISFSIFFKEISHWNYQYITQFNVIQLIKYIQKIFNNSASASLKFLMCCVINWYLIMFAL